MDPGAELKAFSGSGCAYSTGSNSTLQRLIMKREHSLFTSALLTGHRTFDYVIAAQKGYISFREVALVDVGMGCL